MYIIMYIIILCILRLTFNNSKYYWFSLIFTNFKMCFLSFLFCIRCFERLFVCLHVYTCVYDYIITAYCIHTDTHFNKKNIYLYIYVIMSHKQVSNMEVYQGDLVKLCHWVWTFWPKWGYTTTNFSENLIHITL